MKSGYVGSSPTVPRARHSLAAPRRKMTLLGLGVEGDKGFTNPYPPRDTKSNLCLASLGPLEASSKASPRYSTRTATEPRRVTVAVP